MFSLELAITPETVRLAKAELAVALPGVKSSHRVESAARAFGFKTHASLLAAAVSESGAHRAVNGISFREYLLQRGFDVDPPQIYISSRGLQFGLRSISSPDSTCGVWA